MVFGQKHVLHITLDDLHKTDSCTPSVAYRRVVVHNNPVYSIYLGFFRSLVELLEVVFTHHVETDMAPVFILWKIIFILL